MNEVYSIHLEPGVYFQTCVYIYKYVWFLQVLSDIPWIHCQLRCFNCQLPGPSPPTTVSATENKDPAETWRVNHQSPNWLEGHKLVTAVLKEIYTVSHTVCLPFHIHIYIDDMYVSVCK